MLNFEAVRNNEITRQELVTGLTKDDLRDLTNEMIDLMLAMIVDCVDEDVIFEPDDPEAKDLAAADEEDVDLAWTLGHVIVHTTASSEESAALAAEFARGVPDRGGRSRSEIPWETVTTFAQCRHRLEESRRMRLSSLDMWPDDPDLENSAEMWPGSGPVNAVSRFIGGLSHDDSHLEQIANIVKQAHAARKVVS